jgi:acyl-CoA synthetase (AMP-forming)/AMP-acid ligase II
VSAVSGEINVASRLFEQARHRPAANALITPARGGWKRTSYAELAASCARTARALRDAGLERGDRVCVFVRPSAEWVALVYALFAIGAPPVLIDPGMGLRGVLACVERMQPRGFVGIARAQLARLVFRRAFASVRVALTVGALRRGAAAAEEIAPTASDETAAILFTSGSTGPAKGVVYTHGMFDAQLAMLRELYGMREGDVDLACFAPFALFGPALGLTSVLPRIDFSRPATCDPAHVAAAIREHGAVQSFGSPAIWRRVAPWCAQHGVRLDSLKRLMIAGAPVSPALIEQCFAALPSDGDVHTPYGATEALPVSSAGGREILARFAERTRSGEGNCVGRAAPGVELRVIRVVDSAVATWSDALLAPRGEPGELVVRGANVTREYAGEPEATAAAKIRDGASTWHRMGDVVRVDAEGLVWFLGRKSHRIETARGTLFPVGVENVYARHAAVARCALVGVGARGSERPWLVVAPEHGRAAGDELAAEILRAGEAHARDARIEGVLFRDSLPVDVRHNAKIDRGALKRWAEERVR